MRQNRSVRTAAISKLFLFLLLLIILAVGIILGTKLFEGEMQASFGDLDTRFEIDSITYEGRTYHPKPGLMTLLLIGTDNDSELAEYNGSYRSGGQSDFLLLLVINKQEEKVYRIQIDRDTMAEITVLGVFGNNLGTNTHQICLSHGFGDGKHQSCGFTAEAVSRLLCGITIDGYYAMNLEGIPVLNDLLGGVPVTIEDDFSAFDPVMTPGAQVILQGKQTELYVRSRMQIGDGTNFARMRRQRQFLNSAAEVTINRIKAENGFFSSLISGLEDYITTDLSQGRLINEANRAAGYTIEPVIALEGEYTTGTDGFVEFHANQQALTELVVGLFYQPV